MSDVLTISTEKPLNSAFDYEELRKLGISHIEKTASAIWTDYNVHDPGITTLELLCYVITDLSYRINNSIPDLLATSTNAKTNILSHFFSAKKIFPNRAVTINDYRKLIIDTVGVKNAWLTKRSIPVFADISHKKLQFTQPTSKQWEPVEIKGYYDVLLEFDTNVAIENRSGIINEVRETLNQQRNLCEDFLAIGEVNKQEFRLCSELEIKSGADPFDAVARLFFNIQLYLTPLIKFYWLKDLFAQGYTSDKIFEGPLLDHGFIKEEELIASDLKTEIHLSDVMQQILNIDGISNILDIVFNPVDQQKELINKWIIPVAKGKQPVVNILESNILVYKNGMPLRPDMNIIKARFEQMMGEYITGNDLVSTEDITFDTGSFTNTGDYYSFQNHYPKTYGISHWGLPNDATDERRAQAKQLQGYLYIFDQHLANYFAQLSHLQNLFSANDETITYFTAAVRSFKDADDLFVDPATADTAFQAAAENKGQFYKRRNLFLDHLLSRFSESFFDYVNVLYSGFTSNPKDVIIPFPINQDDIIKDKAAFLKNYPEYSGQRFGAYDYTNPQIWDTPNVSGLEKRLERLLGFDNLNRHDLVNLLTSVEHGVNEFNNDEFWFRISDHRNSKILLEGAAKYPGSEEAAFDLEDALTLIYNPVNLRVVANGDGTFSYQVLNEEDILGTSGETYATQEDANAALAQLTTLVTQSRADEGMFLIEHSLLFPQRDESAPESPPDAPQSPPDNLDGFLPICVDSSCKDCEDKDPYSFRISVVLPAYAPRLLNQGFRQYIERTIRMESPAHIFAKICWVSNEQLAEFQDAYRAWLAVKTGAATDNGNLILNRFITIFTALRSIYPVSRLEDCSSSEERTLFLLNQNALGTLKT
ncbi:hypothetical protein GS399_01725 [Pedobacter sp. HMF7647]|uniref:Uncharacterized protein n=1 Tax=Hufsiella arboris TaxID=2695275 RepID=A0A7K1Y516_9SPHI|nr:hypothetical protein [Hufsiella arboris]MXV49675.1 hypothetical protein [Hufsiella arboris]